MSFRVTNVRSDQTAGFRDIDGAFRTNILVSFEMFEDPDLLYRLGFEGQIRETATGVWRSSALLGPATTEVRFSAVEVGTEYDMRFRFIYSNGTIGDWVSSWIDYDDNGVPVAIHTSHTVQGNLQLPPDASGLTVGVSILHALIFEVQVTWVPPDIAGYELRYFNGSTTDWDAMTSFGIYLATHIETAAFPSGHYTFAVKLLTHANDPHEDALAVPPTPKLYNYSKDAFFIEQDVLDPRDSAATLFDATLPTALTGTIQKFTNFSGGIVSPNGQLSGITIDLVAGTMSFPDEGNSYVIKIIADFVLDTTVAGGLASNTNVNLWLRSLENGDSFIGSNFLVDKNKQTALPLFGIGHEIVVPPGDILSIGINTGGGAGNVGLSNTYFEVSFVGYV